jgi:hypothetical protein
MKIPVIERGGFLPQEPENWNPEASNTEICLFGSNGPHSAFIQIVVRPNLLPQTS